MGCTWLHVCDYLICYVRFEHPCCWTLLLPGWPWRSNLPCCGLPMLGGPCGKELWVASRTWGEFLAVGQQEMESLSLKANKSIFSPRGASDEIVDPGDTLNAALRDPVRESSYLMPRFLTHRNLGITSVFSFKLHVCGSELHSNRWLIRSCSLVVEKKK